MAKFILVSPFQKYRAGKVFDTNNYPTGFVTNLQAAGAVLVPATTGMLAAAANFGANTDPAVVAQSLLMAAIADLALSPVANLAALKALASASRSDGMFARVLGTPGQGAWHYNAASTLTGDDTLVATPSDAPSAGRWIRNEGDSVDLALPVDFNKADAAVLYTVPAGFELAIETSFWEVAVAFTGGASSAIGLSSSNAGNSTKGDLLGGSGGDVAATLVATGQKAKGTKGTKVGAPSAYLVGGDTIRFDRITSAFTAGSGIAHVIVTVCVTP